MQTANPRHTEFVPISISDSTLQSTEEQHFLCWEAKNLRNEQSIIFDTMANSLWPTFVEWTSTFVLNKESVLFHWMEVNRSRSSWNHLIPLWTRWQLNAVVSLVKWIIYSTWFRTISFGRDWFNIGAEQATEYTCVLSLCTLDVDTYTHATDSRTSPQLLWASHSGTNQMAA